MVTRVTVQVLFRPVELDLRNADSSTICRSLSSTFGLTRGYRKTRPANTTKVSSSVRKSQYQPPDALIDRLNTSARSVTTCSSTSNSMKVQVRGWPALTSPTSTLLILRTWRSTPSRGRPARGSLQSRHQMRSCQHCGPWLYRGLRGAGKLRERHDRPTSPRPNCSTDPLRTQPNRAVLPSALDERSLVGICQSTRQHSKVMEVG